MEGEALTAPSRGEQGREEGCGHRGARQHSVHPLCTLTSAPLNEVSGQTDMSSSAPQETTEHLLSARYFVHLKALFHVILPTAPFST